MKEFQQMIRKSAYIPKNMQFPKLRKLKTKVAANYKKFAIKLYGQRFVFTAFDRFFANLRKCAISTCNNHKPTRALCNQHHNIYNKYKEKSDTLKDREKRKLFFEAKAHYDSVNAKSAQKKSAAKKRRAENGESNECDIVSCDHDKPPSSKYYCSRHLHAEDNYTKNPSDENKKFLDEYDEHRKLKKEKTAADNAAIRAAGPVCNDCGETDSEKFSKRPDTTTAYAPLCNKCKVAKYDVCHKHSEPGKIYYKNNCIYCKQDDGKQPSQLCHEEFCITSIIRNHAIYLLACARCFRRKNRDHPYTRHYREKEDIFYEFLKSILPNIKIERNLTVHVTLASGVARPRYVDFRIKTTHFIIDIEFDENQHQTIGYDTPCEQMRSSLIFEASQNSGKQYILLRFNPDNFTAKDGDKFRTCFAQKPGAKANISDKAQWDMRTSYLKSRLEECMQLDPKNLELFPHVEHMFFDGFDTSTLTFDASSHVRKRKRVDE